MKIYDLHAGCRIADQQAIDHLTNGQNQFQGTAVDTRVRLLAQAAVMDDKSYAQAGERNRPAGLKHLLHTRRDYNQLIAHRLRDMDVLGLRSPDINLSQLPIGSWFLRVGLTLAKPYVSRDDEAFYIIDNPVKKEKVFRVPYVAASSWKGNLREAMRLLQGWQDNTAEMRALMGNERETDEDLHAGRLHFFPTYFDRIDLEVINPHNRRTGAGTLPIYLEVVPIGSSGTFSMLYIPFDQLSETDEIRCQSAKALFEPLSQSIAFLLLDLGVAAKKSSGFGIANPNSIAGFLQVNDPCWNESESKWHSFNELQQLATKWQEVVR